MKHPKRRRPCCPNGHILSRMVAFERLRKFPKFVPQLNCDHCQCFIRGDDMTGCCEICDYDLCSSCCETPYSVAAAKTPFVSDTRRRKTSNSLSNNSVLLSEGRTIDGTDRYNGLRRQPQNQVHQTPRVHYPDPTLYGWTFTGSSEEKQMEYFEKCFRNGTVLLDVNVHHGMVHTILDTPQRQPEILFQGSTSSPELYLCILKNPLNYKTFQKDHSSHDTSTNHTPFVTDLQSSNSSTRVF